MVPKPKPKPARFVFAVGMVLATDTLRNAGLASVIAFAVAGTPALAEDGVTTDRIVFGQIAALEGPAQALGQGMRQGLLAAFAEANRAGGVAGRKLELKSADDSYEPQKMIEAMKKMLAEDKVLAIVGTVGTPTANAGL